MSQVVDTNVLVSGLNFPGNDRLVRELALRGQFGLYSSFFILEEVSGVLGGKFGRAEDRVSEARLTLEQAATVIEPRQLPDVIEVNEVDKRRLNGRSNEIPSMLLATSPGERSAFGR